MVSPSGFLPGLSVRWFDRFQDIDREAPLPSLILAHVRTAHTHCAALGLLPACTCAATTAHNGCSHLHALHVYPLQELFDALPVHQLVSTSGGWRERLIDVDPQGSSAQQQPSSTRLRLVLAPSETPASMAYAAWLRSATDTSSGASASAPTAAAQQAAAAQLGHVAEGDIREFSPISLALVHAMSASIARTGGAALVVDYGYAEACNKATVRGIKKHEFVDVLQEPGEVDVSADVDFLALAATACSVPSVSASRTITQHDFLLALGLEARLRRLLASVEDGTIWRGTRLCARTTLRTLTSCLPSRHASFPADETAQRRLISEAERLVAPDQMGSVYKVLALTAPLPTASSSAAPCVVDAPAFPPMQ